MATFILTCPCCNGRLTIDPKLEAVVAHYDGVLGLGLTPTDQADLVEFLRTL